MAGGSVKLEKTVSAKLTSAEAEELEAAVMAAGITRSEYIRELLTKNARRPKPTLAAAGRLLAICRILIEAAGKGQLPKAQEEFTLRVFECQPERLIKHLDIGL